MKDLTIFLQGNLFNFNGDNDSQGESYGKPMLNTARFQDFRFEEPDIIPGQQDNNCFVQIQDGEGVTLQAVEIQRGQPEYLAGENNYVSDFVSRRYQLIARQINFQANGFTSFSIDAKILSYLRYCLVRMLPNDTIPAATRRNPNPRTDTLNPLLREMIDSLSFSPAHSFSKPPVNQRVTYDQQGDLEGVDRPAGVRVIRSQNGLIDLISLDQELARIGASNSTFCIVYSFVNILFSQELFNNQHYLMLITLQIIPFLLEDGGFQIMIAAPNKTMSFYQDINVDNANNFMEMEVGQGRPYNDISYRNDQPNINTAMDNFFERDEIIEGYTNFGVNKLTHILLKMNVLQVKTIYEASQVFVEQPRRPQQMNVLQDSLVADTQNLGMIQTALIQREQRNINNNQLYNRVQANVSQILNESIASLYKSFCDAFLVIQQGQQNQKHRALRIDFLIDVLVVFPHKHLRQWKQIIDNVQLDDDEMDLFREQMVDQYQYLTIRNVVTQYPNLQDTIDSPQTFVQSFKEVFLIEYFKQFMQYGIDEEDKALIISSIDVNSRVESISMKPIVWFENRGIGQLATIELKDRYRAHADRVRYSNEEYAYAIQNRQRVYGYANYLQFLVEKVFIDPDYEQYQKDMLSFQCLKRVILFFIVQLKINLNWMFILFDPTKICDDYDLQQQAFQEMLLQKGGILDLDCLLYFKSINKIDVEIADQSQIQVKRFKRFIFFDNDHVFVCSPLLTEETYEMCKKNKVKSILTIQQMINEQPIYVRPEPQKKRKMDLQQQNKSYTMFPAKHDNIYRIPNREYFSDLKKAILFKKTQFRARVYFDFETTYYENDPRRMRKLVKKKDYLDQSPFCVSYKRDIFLPLKQYYDLLKKASQFKWGKHVQFDYKQFDNETRVIFDLDCDEQLVMLLSYEQQNMQHKIVRFNEIITKALGDHEDLIDALVEPNLYAMSYNGAGFDNHLIWQGIKYVFPHDWQNRIVITGNMSSIKILQFDNIFFYDLMLMTGSNCSLATLAESLNTDTKKMVEVKIAEVAPTYEKALENKKLIIEYCRADGEVLYHVFEKFKDSLCEIVTTYCDQVCENDEPEREQTKIDMYLSDLPFKLTKQQYISQFINIWPTISGLSLKIFRLFFLTSELKGVADKEVYKCLRQSYFGGFTQSFWIGESVQEDRIMYLDYNSMYPSIMSRINFPTTFEWFTISNYNGSPKLVRNIDDYFDLFVSESRNAFRLRNPLELNGEGMYQFEQEFGDYDQFVLTYFEFKDNEYSPCIPVKTKEQGTFYPIRFDITIDKERVMKSLHDGIPVFGFQLRRLFQMQRLKAIIITKRLKCMTKSFSPVFKNFVGFLYPVRQVSTNPVFKKVVKTILNSLYGKFGQTEFPVNLILNELQFQDSDQIIQMIVERLKRAHNIDLNEALSGDFINEKRREFMEMGINYDYIKPTYKYQHEHYMITLDNVKYNLNSVSSLIYYATMITAVSRANVDSIVHMSLSPSLYNSYQINQPRLYYCDTDSFLLNYEAYQILIQQGVLMCGKTLGALKDEHEGKKVPKGYFMNRKIYMLDIQEAIPDKEGQLKLINYKKMAFKGIRKPSEKFYEYFKDNGELKNTQINFTKKNAAISIGQITQEFHLKLVRNIVRNPQVRGDQIITHGNYTKPFKNISEYYSVYNEKSGVKFNYDTLNWEVY